MKRARLSECGSCDGSSETTLIHNVRHRGVIIRLCTSCVLRSHPGLFCPICFEVYSTILPPPSERAICLNCPSISHLSCVVRSTSKLPPRYQCPPCSNPTFSFFDVHQYNNLADNLRAINEDTAKQLLAASTIALQTLNLAVTVHRTEAERLVSDAAAAKKAAKESLEHLASLMKAESKPLTIGEKKSPVKPQIKPQIPLPPGKKAPSHMLKLQNNAQPVKLEAKEVRMPVPPFFTRH